EAPRLLIIGGCRPACSVQDGFQVFVAYVTRGEGARAPASPDQFMDAGERVGEFFGRTVEEGHTRLDAGRSLTVAVLLRLRVRLLLRGRNNNRDSKCTCCTVRRGARR